jgi:dephospho-CoA kinase
MMKIIGLTGGIATGKSTVSKLLRRVGIRVIDADIVYKELSKPGNVLYNKIISTFTSAIVGPDYLIDWKQLGQIVYNDDSLRQKLNDLTHPAVKKEILAQVEKFRQTNEHYVVLEVPLLFESGFDSLCDMTIVVKTNPEVQLSRLMTRDLIDIETAQKKIAAQLPLDEKCKRATYVIDNSTDLNKTEKQLQEILEQIRK